MNIIRFSNEISRYAIFLSLVLFVSAAVLTPQKTYSQSAFFMRYEHPNAAELRQKIEESRKILNEAKKNGAHELFFQTSIDLGEMLTVAGREREAVEILEPLFKYDLDKARAEDRAWLYLNYATANQYLRRKNKARAFFSKALKFVKKHDLEKTEHYVLHHYGRFLVENRDFVLAERYFEEALKIRQKLNNARADSTRKALEKLKEMKALPDGN